MTRKTGFIAFVLLRAVRRDLLAYELASGSSADSGDGGIADEGWKLLRSDVFRPPPAADWLAVAVGSGAQVLCCVAATGVLALLGFMSPSSRGALLTATVLIYFLSAGVAGYAAVRTLAAAHAGAGAPLVPASAAGDAAASVPASSVGAVAREWRRVALRTAAALPGGAAATLAAVNVAVRAAGDASGAVPASLFAGLFGLVRSVVQQQQRECARSAVSSHLSLLPCATSHCHVILT